MNLFEDLVEELKGENLLEETVIETSDNFQVNDKQSTQLKMGDYSSKNTSAVREIPTSHEELSSFETELENLDPDFETIQSLQSEDFQSEPILIKTADITEEVSSAPKQPINESEFYRRRATEEVSALKIVEHILSGVEREHMKISPKTYDDVSVSVALHDFLKITESAQSPEHAQSEFRLMQETESWYSSLSYRDKHISVGDLRRYCENSRPPLSMQALISLARFYRNSPFSEAVRSKFDMVVTRLLSREVENNKREGLFEKAELVEQLTGLYADWSSIPLYASDDEPEVLIATLKFQDFVSEANDANSFEELIKNDFFNRLRIFKESTGENFFAPLLTATAIESNMAIGNRYVDLVTQERNKGTVNELEEKYKFLVDQVVSDTTSKTLQIVELLKVRREDTKVKEVVIQEKEMLAFPERSESAWEQEQNSKPFLFGINKWIIALAVFSVLFLGGLYFGVDYFSPPIKTPASVKNVPLENSIFKEYYKTAKINNETFFAITLPIWETLPKETKEDFLKKTLDIGAEKGYKKVHLINQEGKTVGFASQDGIDLTQQ